MAEEVRIFQISISQFYALCSLWGGAAWPLLITIRYETGKALFPSTNSRKYSVSTLSCVVRLLFFCFKHVFLLRLLRVRTSLWVIKSFAHFRIDLFTFLLFSLDSNLLYFNKTIFFFCCICSLARALISVNYSRLCSIIERINCIGGNVCEGVRGSEVPSFAFHLRKLFRLGMCLPRTFPRFHSQLQLFAVPFPEFLHSKFYSLFPHSQGYLPEIYCYLNYELSRNLLHLIYNQKLKTLTE